MNGIRRKGKLRYSRKTYFGLLLTAGLYFVSMDAVPDLRTSSFRNNSNLNILLITIDTLRADRLGCYESQIASTPNIDCFSQASVLFTRAFANTSTTLPSHANILLGTTPLHHGVHENLNFKVDDAQMSIAELLKSHEYETGAFVGAYPLDSRFGLDQGFDVYNDDFSRAYSLDPGSIERKAESVLKSALAWIKGRTTDKPWFLWIHCWDPHIPYDPPEPFKTQYEKNPYEGEVAYVDAVLRDLFGYLDQNRLYDDTVVIFTGDHGESLGQHGEKTHGYFAYNTTIRIPLIIALPGVKSRQFNQNVSHIDIFPTICDCLGIEKPSFLQGRTLFPALTGGEIPDMEIYFESLFPYFSKGWAPLRGFIDKDRKFIDSPIPELYDLNKDFDELENIASEQEMKRRKSRLQKIMEELTPVRHAQSRQKADRSTLEKLASLGYVSKRGVELKEVFGPQDDVKVLLPYVHRTTQSFDLFRAGNKEDAIRLLSDIINERADIDTAYLRLADIYQESGQLEKAREILERGSDAIPSSYEIFLDYMKSLVQTTNYDEAIELFADSGYREKELDPEAWNTLGIACARKEDYQSAVKAYEYGISLDDRDPELHNNLGNVYYEHGLSSGSVYIFQNCFEHYKKAIEIDPDYATPYFGLGRAYQKMERIHDAVSCWEKAMDIKPDFQEAHRVLALTHRSLGNQERACELLQDYKKRYFAAMSAGEKEKFDELLREWRDK